MHSVRRLSCFLTANKPLFHLSFSRHCVCTGISQSAMFVVTGLHTKRRPPIGIDSSSATIEKQCVERLPTVSHQHRHLHLVKHLRSSSSKVAPRVSEPRMTRNDSNKDVWSRREMGRRPAPGRPASARVRKFIPKPLILVERMKARQLLLESSPPVAPDSVNRPTIAMPRSVRPLSVVTLADSSSSTDTFVADSPCSIKQVFSKVPVLAVTSVHLNVESDPDKKIVSDTGVPLFVDSVAADFVHRTCQSTDTFEPFATSTPFTSSQGNTGGVPSPTAFITSTAYPTCPRVQTPGFSDNVGIVSLTSREVYPFNAPMGAYIVKFPDSGSTVSLSNRTSLASLPSTAISDSRLTKSGAPLATLANAPKTALDCKRLSTRVASPSPTLVVDGVFALPRTLSPSSSPSPRRTLNSFPRPRKPTSRRPLSDISNALVIPLSASPTSSRGQAGPDSPRSKLARVLTAHVHQHATTRTRVPPLVKGVEVSNDPRTQREIEGLRVRRAVVRDRSDGGGGVDGESGGSGMIERMSLASVGMVAKLRARWETGAVAHGGGVEGRA